MKNKKNSTLYTHKQQFSIHVFIMYRVPNIYDVIKIWWSPCKQKKGKNIYIYMIIPLYIPRAPRFTLTYIFIHNNIFFSHLLAHIFLMLASIREHIWRMYLCLCVKCCTLVYVSRDFEAGRGVWNDNMVGLHRWWLV